MRMKNIIKKISLGILSLGFLGAVLLSVKTVESAEIEKPEFPTMKISSIPETFQADSELTLTVEQEGFTGDNLFTNWCIDGVPLNSFYAGANDEITFDEIEENGETTLVPRVQGEFGRLIGGSGFCNSPVRPVNADDENFNWWKQTNITKIEDGSESWFFRLFFGSNLAIYRTSNALMVGMEKRDKPMDPIFIQPEFTGDVILSSESEQDVTQEELQEIAELVGLESGAAIIDGDGSYLLVPDGDENERLKEVVQDVKDQGIGIKEFDGTSGIDLSNIPDSIQSKYRVGGNQTKLYLYDSYETYKVSEASEEETKLEEEGYEVDILWDTVTPRLDDDGNNITEDDDDGNPINIYDVRLRIFEPLKVTINPVKFEQYWLEVFGESKLFESNSDEVALAYQDIANRFTQSTWGENRDMWYGRDRRENTIYMSRVFHILQDDSDEKEGDIYKDGSVYENLPSYKDRDEDGIPDLWEMKNFGALAGKEITKPSEPKKKAQVWFNSCCIFGDDEVERETDREDKLFIFLQQVSPTDDWDGDGFDWKNRAYREWKQSYNHYPQPAIAGLGPYIERNRIVGGGKGSLNRPGDKELNNYEEYVMGTNPIEIDTDGDGVPDELDFYGLSQNTIKIKLNKKVGNDDYLITSRAYGPILRGNYTGQPHFGRADAIRNVKQGGELPLEVQLSMNPNPSTTSDEVTILAGVGNTNTVDSKLLFFQWYLNDIPIQSPPGEKPDQVCPCTPEALENTRLLGEQSGFGKTSFTFPASLGASSACNAAEILLEVTDPSSDQTVTAQTQVPITMDTVLIKNVKGNLPDNGEGVGEGVSENDQLIEDVSPNDIGGIRADDLLEITAYLKGYKPEYCGVVEIKDEAGQTIVPQDSSEREAQYMNSLTYIWYIDGVERNDLSGKGRRKIDFSPSAEARVSPDARDNEQSSSNADDHEIIVEVYDKDKNLISRTEEGIKVLAPYVEFDLSGTGVRRMPTSEGGKNEIKVLKNSDVIIRADAQYLKPATEYVFTWTRNNEDPQEFIVQIPIGEINITAGAQEGFDQLEEISVSIVGRDEKGEEKETVVNQISFEVVEELDFSEGNELPSFVGKFLPNNLRGIINFTAGFSVIALIMIFAYGFKANKKIKL